MTDTNKRDNNLKKGRTIRKTTIKEVITSAIEKRDLIQIIIGTITGTTIETRKSITNLLKIKRKKINSQQLKLPNWLKPIQSPFQRYLQIQKKVRIVPKFKQRILSRKQNRPTKLANFKRKKKS